MAQIVVVVVVLVVVRTSVIKVNRLPSPGAVSGASEFVGLSSEARSSQGKVCPLCKESQPDQTTILMLIGKCFVGRLGNRRRGCWAI